jgi:hypothetical protein
VVHHLLMLFLLVFSLNYVSFISVLPPVLFVVFLFWFSSSLQSSSSHNYILAGCSSASIDSSSFNPFNNFMIIITLALVFITHFIIAFIASVLGLLYVCDILYYALYKTLLSGERTILILKIDVLLNPF